MNADPLAALRPIHLPDAVSWWPPAPGWWLLGCLLLVALSTLAWWLVRRWRSSRYRRSARRQLKQIYQQHASNPELSAFATQASQILRRAALAHYPRERVAALCQDDWLGFLDTSAGTTAFSNGAGRALVDAAYRPTASGDCAALYRLCADWLRKHR